MPRLFAPPLGMVKLYQQRPSWTRLQTNVKVCEVVFRLSSPALFSLSFDYAWSKEFTCRTFNTQFQNVLKNWLTSNVSKHSFDSYAVVSDDQASQETDSQAA